MGIDVLRPHHTTVRAGPPGAAHLLKRMPTTAQLIAEQRGLQGKLCREGASGGASSHEKALQRCKLLSWVTCTCSSTHTPRTTSSRHTTHEKALQRCKLLSWVTCTC